MEKQKLKSALVGASFGYAYNDVKGKLESAIERLLDAVQSEQVAAQGRFHSTIQGEDDAANRIIESHEARDYRAFDILSDGLRYGRGVLWLPDESNDYEHKRLVKQQHFSDVMIFFPDLKNAGLQQGTSPAAKQATMRTIPYGMLEAWFNALPEDEQLLSQYYLFKAGKNAFSEHEVPREYIRRLTPGRTRGPRRKS